MKNVLTVVVFALLLSTTSVLADTDAGVFDQELPDGMTISQTLNEWDRSAERYHSEPPMMEMDEVAAPTQEIAPQS